MERPVITRRGLLAAGLAGALARAPRARAQQSETGFDPTTVRFRSIVVDASPIERLGSPRTAAMIQRQVDGDARTVFADRLAFADPRAPQLLIRLDSLQLASYVGDNAMMAHGASNTDYLEGAGLVVSGRQVLSTTPILSALDASYSGAWYLPDIDERRVASISQHFTSWLRREMGL